MTWSTFAGSRPDRSSAALAAAVPRSAAEREDRAPPNLPMGVRTGAARRMSWSLFGIVVLISIFPRPSPHPRPLSRPPPSRPHRERGENPRKKEIGPAPTAFSLPFSPLPVRAGGRGSGEGPGVRARAGAGILPPHINRLDLRIRLDRLLAELAAEAALLVAAEGRGGVVPVVLVDPHRPGLDAPRHLVGLADIARPHAGGEAVDRGVGELDGFLDLLERDDGEHRPEDFLAGHLHVVAHAVEDRGLHEPALAADRRRPAAVHHPGAFALPLLHITEHRLPLLPGDQGAELRPRIERIAGRQPLRTRHQTLDELAVH